MKTHFMFGCTAIGLLMGCGNSVNQPASEAVDLASSIFSDKTDDSSIESHTREVASKLTFESVTYTYKQETPDEDTECGWSSCNKLEDETRCYIKYTDGEEWGILEHLTHDCEGNDKEDSLKRAMKSAKSLAKDLIHYSRNGEKAEIEFTAKKSESIVKMLIGANAKMGDKYDIQKCIDDYVDTVGDNNLDYYNWGCDTEWTGEMLVKRMGYQVEIDKLAKQIELAACDEDDDSCKNQKVKWENDKKMVEGKKTYASTLTEDKAKLFAYVNLGTGKSCLNKWLFDDSGYTRFFMLDSAYEVCSLD